MKTEKSKTVAPLGIARRMDSLNRLVIPREYVNKMNWQPDDEIEILAFEDDTLLLRRMEK